MSQRRPVVIMLPSRRGFATIVARHATGTPVASIDTPALVVDLDAMERNLQRMQNFAQAHKVLLRPHAKMHKCAAIAKIQMAAGAVGVCVQKTSEAEALAADGVHDIYISNEVTNLAKLRRVAALAGYLQSQRSDGSVGLAICCDSVQGVQNLAQAVREVGATRPVIRVLVELDVGQQRCGSPSLTDAVAVAKEIEKNSDIFAFGGVQAYHGGAQHIRDVEERRRVAIAFTELAASLKRELEEKAGIPVPLVTGAGTGTFPFEATSGLYGELQAGSYLFMDRDYGDNASHTDEGVPLFEHALFVLTEVMSVTHPEGKEAICDAGHKSHAIDSGLPRVFNRPDITFVNKGDEHGKLVTSAATAFKLGDRFALVPGHCDPTVNLYDAIVGVRGGLERGHVEQVFEVTARGCLT